MRYNTFLFIRSLLLLSVVMFLLSYFVFNNFEPISNELCSEKRELKYYIIEVITIHFINTLFISSLLFLKIDLKNNNRKRIITILSIPVFTLPLLYVYHFFIWECRSRSMYITGIYLLINTIHIIYLNYEIKRKSKFVN